MKFRRTVPLILSVLLCAIPAFASEIREFDIKTLERLGNELTRVSQTADRGATTPERKRAKQTAIAALKGKLFDIRYNYVVFDDPNGNGFLVYALGAGGQGQYVLAGHMRVSVSADRATVKRIDPLSHTLVIEDQKHNSMAKDNTPIGLIYSQIVSNKPVETLIYISNLARQPVFVGTPDHKMWQVANGKMFIDHSKPGANTAASVARKSFQENDRW
jgi:hypothetical protein